MQKSKSKQKIEAGFTLVELMIATTVFAVVLLIVTFGILQVTRTYYKGATTTKTQQAARSIIDQISQAIQFSGSDPVITPSTDPAYGTPANFCINGTRYSYMLNRQLAVPADPAKSQATHVLVSDSNSACKTATPIPLDSASLNLSSYTKAKELMATNMRLSVLKICAPGPVTPACPNPPPANSNLFMVSVRVVAGDDDLLVDSTGKKVGDPAFDVGTANCLGGAGGQFCAVSSLTTTVERRLQ